MTSASRWTWQRALATELRVVRFTDDPRNRLTVTGQADPLTGSRTGDHVSEIFAHVSEGQRQALHAELLSKNVAKVRQATNTRIAAGCLRLPSGFGRRDVAKRHEKAWS